MRRKGTARTGSSARRRGVALALACLALGASIGVSAPSAAQSDGVRLVFVVHGLRTDTGLVRGGIYDRSDVWTVAGGQVGVCTARPHGGTARCVIDAAGPGRYAFAFYHDADGDGVLDVDMVGIPQEGYGFSNDVRPGLGPPSFESAAFEVLAAVIREMRVVTRYGWSP